MSMPVAMVSEEKRLYEKFKSMGLELGGGTIKTLLFINLYPVPLYTSK